MFASLALVIGMGFAGASEGSLEHTLGKRVLPVSDTLEDYDKFFRARQRPGPERFTDRQSFAQDARRLRQALLDEVFLQGAVKEWAKAPVRVEESGPPLVGQWHRVRRFRLEIIPGLWTSMWLHEPLLEPVRAIPVVLSFIGHGSGGDATDPVHQARAIHLARQGLYVVTVDWFGNGELDGASYAHMALNHIDLWGTNGVGLMYLLMERAVDFALKLEHVDAGKVAATGLSGGGWQTIILAALDERVTLAAPVAGFSGFATTSRVHADLGDSEQAPPGLYRIADYTEIAALVAPRPLLLTYNYPESCCFRSDRVVPLLQRSLEPIYGLHGAPEALRFHIDHRNPGTHNYEADNRRAFYRMLVDNGFVGETAFDLEEDEIELDVRTPEELFVGLPDDNTTLMQLARRLAEERPRSTLPEAAAFSTWQQLRRRELADLLGPYRAPSTSWQVVRAAEVGELALQFNVVTVGSFKVPVVIVKPANAVPEPGTVIVLGDEGRAALATEVASLARTRQVALVDLLHFGDRRHRLAEPHYSMLLGSLGESSLGVQTVELAAVAAHLAKSGPVELRAIGRRASFIATVTAARSSDVTKLVADRLVGDLAHISAPRPKTSIYHRPEMFAFGLGQRFSIEALLAMALPATIEVNLLGRSFDEDALEDLADDIDAPEPELD